MCQEKKEEEDFPALKIALMNQYDDSNTTRKKEKKEKFTTIRNNVNNTRINRTIITRKQKWTEKQLNGYFKR